MWPKVFIHFSLFFWGPSQWLSAIAFLTLFSFIRRVTSIFGPHRFSQEKPTWAPFISVSNLCSALLVIVSPHFAFYRHSHLPLPSGSTDRDIPPSGDAPCRTQPALHWHDSPLCLTKHTKSCLHVFRMSMPTRFLSLWVQWQQVLASVSLCRKAGNCVIVHKREQSGQGAKQLRKTGSMVRGL